LNDLTADAERRTLDSAAARATVQELAAAASATQGHLERQIVGLREQLERLARLFIDPPDPSASQAA
jgi:hypothetical protein